MRVQAPPRRSEPECASYLSSQEIRIYEMVSESQVWG